MRATREPGPLAISIDVRGALVRLLVGTRAKVEPVPEIPLEAVAALEDHLRAKIHDDALALFAAKTAMLDALELGKVGALCETSWDRGLSKARVVLGPIGPRLLCIPRRPDAGAALRVTFYDPRVNTEADAKLLAVWLDEQLEVDDEDRRTEIEIEAADLRWSPSLVRTLPVAGAAAPSKVRRVRHEKFGVGTVLREVPGTEKLEIDFGEAGVRVLVAKYVEDLGDA
jgi:hypothetical protein